MDQFGQVIDVFVSSWRDAAAARPVLRAGTWRDEDYPVEVITDHAGTYPIVLRSCCRRRGIAPSGIAPIGTPTAGSRRITAG
jgi:transposase-like protein